MNKETKEKFISLGQLKKMKIPVSRKMLLDKIEKGEVDENGKILLEGKAIAKAIEWILVKPKASDWFY